MEILDVGCGTNSRFKAMPRGTVNCDIDKPLVKIPNFVRCDARKLPFTNESFDYVLLYNVLEHIADYHFALLDAIRVSRQGVIVRVDGFLTLRNLMTLDHEYLTLGLRFVKTPAWLKRIRKTKIFNPYQKANEKVYKIIYKAIKVIFRIMLRLRYLNYSRSWHYFFISKHGKIQKIKGKFINTKIESGGKYV